MSCNENLSGSREISGDDGGIIMISKRECVSPDRM
jgi:hypothetical protein